jgi:uncharacterized protein YhaN
MFIERIVAERFGGLSQVTIDRLAPGVQVLYGTNETGKTSLLEFGRAVFFGFEGLFRRGVLDPRVPCAGRLLVRTGPERTLVAIERRHEGPEIARLTRESYADDVVGLGGDHGDLIEIADVDPRSEGHRHRLYLQDLVGGIDETAFTNVMAFGLDELHELRTLEPEGCGSRLYELASGLDRSKVARVLGHLRDAIVRLDADDPAVSPIRALEARRQEALARLVALDAPAVAAGGLWAELAHLDAEIRAIEVRIAAALRDEAVVRGVLPLQALHDVWRRTATPGSTHPGGCAGSSGGRPGGRSAARNSRDPSASCPARRPCGGTARPWPPCARICRDWSGSPPTWPARNRMPGSRPDDSASRWGSPA